MSGANANVSVNINGNSYPAQNAIQGAVEALRRLTQQANYTQQATKVLGASTTQSGLTWLSGAKNAQEYTQRLSFLQAQLGYAQQQQGQVGQQNQQTNLTWQSLGQSILSNLGPMGSWLVVAGSIVSLATPFIDAFKSAADTVVQFAEHLGTDLVQAAQAAAQEIENLTQQVFQLTEQTEHNFFNWAFLWGGINQQTGTGRGLGPAQALSNWSLKASLNMPFTRQDLMAAITTLSAMPNQTVPGIEKDLTLLSDVASTQGRPGLTLQWAAMAAMRAGQGYGRMLLMDLNISKTQLEKFGYNEKDSSTFFPALEKYEKWKGSYGASKYVSQNTFWGAQTSFVDRLQNFALAVGGWNQNPKTMTDDVTKGSFFAQLKDALVGISTWIDKNGDKVGRLSDLFGNILAGGVKSASSALQGLLDGLQSSGLGEFLFGTKHTYGTIENKHGHRQWVQHTTYSGGILSDFGKWLNSKGVQSALHEIGDVVGRVIGPGLKDAAEGARSFMDALGNSGVGQNVLQKISDFGQWLASPDVQRGIKQLGDTLGTIAGKGLSTIFDSGKKFLDGLGQSGAGQEIWKDLQGFAKWLSDPQHQHQIENVAMLVGLKLGAAFLVAATGVKTLIDALGNLVTILGDLGPIMQDIATGNWTKLGADASKFLTDWNNGIAKTKDDITKLSAAIGNLDTSLPNFGNGGNQPGKPKTRKDFNKQHVLNYFGADGNGNLTPGTHAAAHTAGNQLSNSIVKGAMDGFKKSTGGQALVDTLVSSLTRQVTSGGKSVGQVLSQVVWQTAQKAVHDALLHQDFFGSLTNRQGGGYNVGATYGYR